MSTVRDNTSQFLGALCIVAGTAIGAAMLALPVVMGRAGFFPSLTAFVGSWCFMSYSALLFLELCTTYKQDTNVISLAQHTLGKIGTGFASSAYLILLYSLLTAYIAALSQIVSSFFDSITYTALPQEAIATLLFIGTVALFTKGIKLVDNINKIMMIGLGISFLFLIIISMGNLKIDNLRVMRWEYLVPSLSIGFTSFGFHVVIPSLSKYLNYDSKKLVRVLLLGSFLPLIIYTIWQAICLLQIPMTSTTSFSIDGAYERGMTGAEILSELTNNSLIRFFSDSFAITAIITSFLGVSLGMVDFIRDGLGRVRAIQSNRSLLKYGALILAFIPPTCFSSSPHIFYKALDIAGVFGVVLLLSLLPACMVYKKRYVIPPQIDSKSSYQAPGGKKILSFYILMAFLLVLGEAITILS